MAEQQQFLNVIDRGEAERRFLEALNPQPLEVETVSLPEALGRVLARDVVSPVNVPSFDRSNFDGFAVRAEDTYEATEQLPKTLRLLDETVATGVVPQSEIATGTAVAIATGGMLPRGADAVVMIEHTELSDNVVTVRKAVASGFGVAFTGTDISIGETVCRNGSELSSHETGVLAAVGVSQVDVWRQPRVAIVSTGDEIIAPGEPMRPGLVFDSNATILADAVRELGGIALPMGIVHDDVQQLRAKLQEALGTADVVLLSGGTSKGAGDLSYRIVAELDDPGIVAHGVALKPGKPICLAASGGKPVVILPGFPTSAIFTFHEFLAPVIRQLGGRSAATTETLTARLAVPVNSDVGRTEYVLVGIVPGREHLAAYPMGKGSGSVTTFSRADGFVTIDRHQEIVDAETQVEVQLLGKEHRLADLVVIGSHCIGLDYLLGEVQKRGYQTKFLAVGSTAGLQAAQRGECDAAGIHLLDENSGRYNIPFIDESLHLVAGYHRMQGVVFRTGDDRFTNHTAESAIESVKDDPDCLMINRNLGSGTRILIDRELGGAQPAGYAVQTRNHHAVAAAVQQGRADWGVAIEHVTRNSDLQFLPLADEQYDLVIPKTRLERPAVQLLVNLLQDTSVRSRLADLGLQNPSGVSGSDFSST